MVKYISVKEYCQYRKCAIDYLEEESAHEWAETVAEMAKEYGFEG